MPTVSIVGSAFRRQSTLVAKGLGLPLALAEYPGAPMVDTDADVLTKTEEHLLPAIIAGLTQVWAGGVDPAEAPEPHPGDIVLSGALDDIEEHFHRHLWSDGLPIVPPTASRVSRFLHYTDLPPDHVIAVLPQEGREATPHSIAVNAVMAGCRPEYMPVLIAIVEAMADPHFRIEDAGSTPSWEPLVVVSGPIAGELGLNHGAGLMKIGRQANASIGRFVRLFLRNVCGYRIPPGDGDKGSIGYTFNVAMAEDETTAREIGWPTFGMDMGFRPDENAVTVQSVVSISPPVYSAGAEPEGHVRQFSDVLGGAFGYRAYTGINRGVWHSIIVIGPGIARTIAARWSKDDVRRYLCEHTRLPASLVQHFARQTGGLEIDFEHLVAGGILAPDYADSPDPDRPVRMFVKAEHIGIVVAGDPGRNQSRGYMANHMEGARTSRRIVLPARWHALSNNEGGVTSPENKEER